MKKKFNIYEIITQQLTTKIEKAIKEKSVEYLYQSS